MVAACRSPSAGSRAAATPAGSPTALGVRDVLPDQLEQGADGAAAVARQFAADQVHRLDAVGAFVDLGDPRVAHELLDAVLADVAMAAEHLLCMDRGGKALVGEISLDHRGDQPEQIVGLGALRLIGRAADEVDEQGTPQHQRPARFIPGPRFHQHPANVGMDDDRIGAWRRGRARSP